CVTHYNSCTHPETQCYEYLAYTTPATLRLSFDPAATLLPGEQEKIKVRVDGRGAEKTLKVDIDGARHVYSYPETMDVYVGNQTAVVQDVEVKLVNDVQVRPANNVTIASARYLDDKTLQIQLQDPWANAQEIVSSVYRLRVSRGLREYVDVQLPTTALTRQPDGTWVAIIRQGDAGWNRPPSAAGGDSFRLTYQVERKSALFQDTLSEKKSTKFQK
ncbi:MAG TPA: hypothetical protein VL588_05725, partial [Bdellovibrionota bacterium]|nr:hypothetical protein [Bdellovibrionota bacterium]